MANPTSFKAAVAALFTRLQTITTIKTFERRLFPVETVLTAKMPMLMLVTDSISPGGSEVGMPRIHVIHTEAHLVVRPDQQIDPPDQVLLEFVDAIREALEKQPGEQGVLTAGQDETTLGGAVRRAYIGGDIDVYPSTVKDGCVAVIPIDLLITD